MTQTFTPALEFNAGKIRKESQKSSSLLAEPSNNTIRNILNFSKNLEVKQSQFVEAIEVMKS